MAINVAFESLSCMDNLHNVILILRKIVVYIMGLKLTSLLRLHVILTTFFSKPAPRILMKLCM